MFYAQSESVKVEVELTYSLFHQTLKGYGFLNLRLYIESLPKKKYVIRKRFN